MWGAVWQQPFTQDFEVLANLTWDGVGGGVGGGKTVGKTIHLDFEQVAS